MPADWQLPPGVDRGLWDYFSSADMVAAYDGQMAVTSLASADEAFCVDHFPRPDRLIDLGCGTGRLCLHFGRRGFDCLGVDLSETMLDRAKANAEAAGVGVRYLRANIIDLADIPDAAFAYAACLFSTFGMIRGDDHRRSALRSAARVVRPGGRLYSTLITGGSGVWDGDDSNRPNSPCPKPTAGRR